MTIERTVADVVDGDPYRGHTPATHEERFWRDLYEIEWAIRKMQHEDHLAELAWMRTRVRVWVTAALFGCAVNTVVAIVRAL